MAITPCRHTYCDCNLEVACTNTAAISLYKKVGFRTVGHRKRYYPNGDDAWLMTWSIDAHKDHFPNGRKLAKAQP